MYRTTLALLGVLALAACGGDEKADETPPAAPAAAAPAPEPETPPGPPPVEGYDWAMHGPVPEEPDRAFLSYSVPETDDVPLMMSCDRGSGTISANTDSGVTGVGAIILRAGEAEVMYPVTTRTPSELSGGEFLSVDIPVTDAPLQAFRSSGWINLSVAGQARDLAAHPGPARQAIEQFFAFCAPAPAASAPSAPG